MIWIIAILIGLIPALIAYKKGYPSKNEGYNFFVWWAFGASLFIEPYARDEARGYSYTKDGRIVKK